MRKLLKTGLATTALVALVATGFGIKNSAEAQDRFENANSTRLAHAYGGERGSGRGMRERRMHRGHGRRHGWRRGGKRRKMRRMRAMMNNYDVNGDQKLTFDELESGRKQQIEKFDRDNNGGISLQEFAPLWAELRRQRIIRTFQRMDRDGDGKITEEEFVKPAMRFARRLDRNGDGALSREDRRRKRGFWRRRGGEEGGYSKRPRKPEMDQDNETTQQ